MSKVPPGWRSVSLGSLVDVLDGRRVPVNSTERAGRPGSVPYYGAAGRVGWIDEALFDEDLLLLGEDGVQFFDPAKPKAYRIKGPAWVNNHAHVLRAGAEVDWRFLEHYLNWFDYRGFANGTTRLKLTQAAMRRIPVTMPPLGEQRRIVEILEDHLSRLDAANDYLDAAVDRVAPWRQASVDSAFLHQLPQLASAGGPTPDFRLERRATTRNDRTGAPCAPNTEGLTAPPWQVVSLEAACDAERVIRYGILKPRVDGCGTVPYVEVKDLAGYTLAGKELRRTSDELDLQFHGARIRQGDVVIAVRGSYERAAVVPAGMNGTNISRDVARVAPLPSLDPTFLWHWLQTSIAKGYLRRHARGVAVKGVNISTLRALPVPAVPREAQLQLVTALENVASAPARTEAQIIAARRRSGALRSALLAAAFSGRLTGRSSDLKLAEEMAFA